MSLFSKKPTLEERLAETESLLTAAHGNNQTLTDSLAAALARATDLETQLTAANATRDAAAAESTQNAAALQTRLDAAAVATTALRASLRSSLQLTEEQFSALAADDQTVIPAAITRLAQQKAIEIAASQGVPALPTQPTASAAEDDEINLAFQTAREEADPLRRGQLYARASALVAKKKPHGNN